MEVDYEEYVRANRTRFTVEVLKRGDTRRLPSRRRRDEEEERLLTYLDSVRWQRSVGEGKIVYLGERTYRFRLSD
jgi:hypothetical protein